MPASARRKSYFGDEGYRFQVRISAGGRFCSSSVIFWGASCIPYGLPESEELREHRRFVVFALY